MDVPRFFERMDPSPDAGFYSVPRLVDHIDPDAVAAVGRLYAELALGEGRVLDLMASWVSHLVAPPPELVGLGMNADELDANPALTERVVHDLNADPRLPFPDADFDGVVCTVSVDYLVRPFEVFAEVARVLRPGAPFACTFSNRCFPTKAIRGWLEASEPERPGIVLAYFERTGGWSDPRAELRTDPRAGGDPLWGVWARRKVQ